MDIDGHVDRVCGVLVFSGGVCFFDSQHLPSEKVAQEFYQDLLAILVPLLK